GCRLLQRHVQLQQDQRRARLRQQEAADRHPTGRVGLPGLRGRAADHAGPSLHTQLPGDGHRLRERGLQPGALQQPEGQRLHEHQQGCGPGQHHAGG
uniref:Uncharacterized protein n=1 Tax=Pelodiscus sinensis TaxID=13735 RepID=K7FU20_PELSI